MQSIETTVIIPTYNRRDLLEEAIESVLQQSYRDFELIVVDDGSTDNTADFLKQLPGDIRVLSQENRGPSAARNAGIAVANGEFITFLDSDDKWLPDKLAIQIEFMHAHPEAMVCYTDAIWIRNGVRVNPKRHHSKKSGWIFEDCVPLCIVRPSSVLMRRKFFDEVGLFDEALPSCEDYDLWLRAALKMPFHFIEQQLIIKRGGHKGQLSANWGLDRYRVQVILKLLSRRSEIDNSKLELLRTTAMRKCEILCNGFEKRGKHTEAQFYEKIRKRLLAGELPEQSL